MRGIFIQACMVLSCFISLGLKAQTPAAISRVLADQRKWQVNQLPANSVLRKFENHDAYSTAVPLGKKVLPTIAIPTYWEMQNAAPATNPNFQSMLEQQFQQYAQHRNQGWRKDPGYAIGSQPINRFLQANRYLNPSPKNQVPLVFAQ